VVGYSCKGTASANREGRAFGSEDGAALQTNGKCVANRNSGKAEDVAKYGVGYVEAMGTDRSIGQGWKTIQESALMGSEKTQTQLLEEISE